MGKGFTSYLCSCGGEVSEQWDWYGSETKCNKCNNPKPLNTKGEINMEKINSKDYEILIERIEEEIRKNHELIQECNKEDSETARMHKEVAEGYIEYHQEMISFIKKLDEEIK